MASKITLHFGRGHLTMDYLDNFDNFFRSNHIGLKILKHILMDMLLDI